MLSFFKINLGFLHHLSQKARALFQATLTDALPTLSAASMDYLDYGNTSEAISNESDEESHILVLIDDNISPDEIDRHFDKDACHNTLDLV